MIQPITCCFDGIDLSLELVAKARELGVPGGGADSIEFAVGHQQLPKQLEMHFGQLVAGHTALLQEIEGLCQRVLGELSPWIGDQVLEGSVAVGRYVDFAHEISIAKIRK